MPTTRTTILFSLATLLFLASCSTSKQLTTPAQTVEVADTLPTLPVSQIDCNLKIPGKSLLAAADSFVQKEFFSDGWPNWLQPSCDFRYKYRFLRSAFTIHCIDNRISIHLDGRYQV